MDMNSRELEELEVYATHDIVAMPSPSSHPVQAKPQKKEEGQEEKEEREQLTDQGSAEVGNDKLANTSPTDVANSTSPQLPTFSSPSQDLATLAADKDEVSTISSLTMHDYTCARATIHAADDAETSTISSLDLNYTPTYSSGASISREDVEEGGNLTAPASSPCFSPSPPLSSSAPHILDSPVPSLAVDYSRLFQNLSCEITEEEDLIDLSKP